MLRGLSLGLLQLSPGRWILYGSGSGIVLVEQFRESTLISWNNSVLVEFIWEYTGLYSGTFMGLDYWMSWIGLMEAWRLTWWHNQAEG